MGTMWERLLFSISCYKHKSCHSADDELVALSLLSRVRWHISTSTRGIGTGFFHNEKSDRLILDLKYLSHYLMDGVVEPWGTPFHIIRSVETPGRPPGTPRGLFYGASPTQPLLSQQKM
ncbi:hypothetical protein EYF80_058015 [Liparis tanakae]|uniref:Uncharacterized protein n=1 Tax=Liparis tanakae TaxID=230148 RepID=A0A4Z2ESD5_9TELE|nr:hypothetical protein EYF80_058015 [Liparis tanakae]